MDDLRDSPLVSAIVPAYQRAHLLERAVKSALNAGKNVEVILVNDASPDDETAGECDRLGAQLPNVRVVHHAHNTGVAGARNTGIGLARGEFIAFVDCDDIRLPDSFEPQIAALQANPAALFCYGRSHIARSDDLRPLYVSPRNLPQLPSGDIWEFLLEFCPFWPVATLVRRRAFDEVGLMDTALTKCDDWDLWIRLSEVAPVAAVEDVVAIYRKTDPSSTQQTADLPAVFRPLLLVQKKAFQSPRGTRLTPGRQRALRRITTEICLYLLLATAIQHLRYNRKKAFASLLFAIQCAPLLSLQVVAHVAGCRLRRRRIRVPAPLTRM